MKKALYFFTAHPARFFLLAALLWGGVMCFLNYLDYKKEKFDWHDLLVEANGMVFDLLVFGILLSIYERLREKRDKIERLHEEIDDYRGWDEREAIIRVLGVLKRLNKLGVTKIDLRGFSLQNTNLEYLNLKLSKLQKANLRGAKLWGIKLQGAQLRGAIVDKDWFEKLDKWNVIGREEIKEKYFIDEEGRLQEKQ